MNFFWHDLHDWKLNVRNGSLETMTFTQHPFYVAQPIDSIEREITFYFFSLSLSISLSVCIDTLFLFCFSSFFFSFVFLPLLKTCFRWKLRMQSPIAKVTILQYSQRVNRIHTQTDAHITHYLSVSRNNKQHKSHIWLWLRTLNAFSTRQKFSSYLFLFEFFFFFFVIFLAFSCQFGSHKWGKKKSETFAMLNL